MKQKIIKYSTEKAQKTEDDRVLRFIGSDKKIDRDGDIVDGWKLTEYKKNPVVLFSHNYYEAPVAKTKKVFMKDDILYFDIEFPEASVSAIGDSLYKLYKGGFMNATSIGFIPDYDKIEYPRTKGGPSRIMKDVNLLEISLVSVPANPRALLQSKSIDEAKRLKIVDDLELEQIAKWLVEDDNTDKADVKDTDYDTLLKEVKQDIENDKKENYFYKLFEIYKDTVENEDNIYQEMINELS